MQGIRLQTPASKKAENVVVILDFRRLIISADSRSFFVAARNM